MSLTFLSFSRLRRFDALLFYFFQKFLTQPYFEMIGALGRTWPHNFRGRTF